MAPDRHSMTEMHRATNDATGTNITSGYAPLADGSGGVAWGAVSSSNAELNIEGGLSVLNARGTLGATESIDPTDGNIISGTLDQNCTITVAAPSTASRGSTLEWWLTQSGGSWTPTFTPTGGSFAWDGGVTPTFPAAGQTFRIVTERIPGTTNDLIGNMVGSGSSFATPAIVLGTAAAAGAATTVIRSDSTIVAFDATVPTTIAAGATAATGAAAVAARRDHTHGAPSSFGITGILMTTGLAPPDPLLDTAGEDWLVST